MVTLVLISSYNEVIIINNFLYLLPLTSMEYATVVEHVLLA